MSSLGVADAQSAPGLPSLRVTNATLATSHVNMSHCINVNKNAICKGVPGFGFA